MYINKGHYVGCQLFIKGFEWWLLNVVQTPTVILSAFLLLFIFSIFTCIVLDKIVPIGIGLLINLLPTFIISYYEETLTYVVLLLSQK